MERGYSFSFSREYRLLSKNYHIIFIILIITITAMMILITGLTENWKSAAKIISVIPASLSIPMIIIFLTAGAFELGDIVGMIVLSGITVNNAIYITESKQLNYSFKLREKIKSILVTSLTTIAGAVPLYLLSADPFSKSLSFFMIWGIISSVIIVLSAPQDYSSSPKHPAPRNAGSCAER